MRSADFDAFATLLADVWSLKGQVLSGGAKAMWFRALAAYPLEIVQGALDAHLADPMRGQFLPMPADVIAQIDQAVADDGRPGAEEAWAIAMRSTDEADTVVWTAEMAEAFGIARPVLMAGDEVGARMAFKESYGRLVDDARRRRHAPDWSASLGFDPELRTKAVEAAVSRGLLPASAAPQLPAPRGVVPLLAQSSPDGMPEAQREALQRIRDGLTNPPEAISADAAGKADTESRRQAATEAVLEYVERLK